MDANLDWLSIVSIIVAILSTLISTGTALYVHFKTESYNKMLIKKDYFDKILFDILYLEIPQNMSKINWNGNGFNKDELNAIQDSVKDIITKILFYKFYESAEFYDMLRDKLKEFEKEILYMDQYDLPEFCYSLDQMDKALKMKGSLEEKYKDLCIAFSDYIKK